MVYPVRGRFALFAVACFDAGVESALPPCYRGETAALVASTPNPR